MLAVVRLRGDVDLSPDVRKTLDLLQLDRQYTVVFLPDKPDFRGMIKKVNDYVMWGETDQKFFKSLSKKLEPEGKQLKFFHMHPPRGGLKSIKRPWPKGNLGKVPEIEKWIEKMLPVQKK